MQDKSPLSILITAGGTQEDIDTVRSVTNHATGRLGSLIADAFLRSGAKVTYLCGENALQPESQADEVIKIRNTAQLLETLNKLLEKNLYDCVIHSMAVSDFTPHAITTVDEIAQAIQLELSGDGLSENEVYTRIQNVLSGGTGQPAEKKISSESPYLLLVLKQNPKVIRRIKAVQPQTLLVGFKLLSGASEPGLLEAGLKLIERNGCDYVLANDLDDISGDTHKAVLMDKSGIICSAGTKPEIAQMILGTVTERINGAR